MTYKSTNNQATKDGTFTSFWPNCGVTASLLLVLSLICGPTNLFGQSNDYTGPSAGHQDHLVRYQSGRGPKTLFHWRGCPSPPSSDAADDGPLVTDRPDFTEASSTVGLGRVQFEMGYTYGNDEAGGIEVTEHTYPEMLVRIGMFADWFELRIVWTEISQVTRIAGTSSRVTGSNDMQIGAKIALTEQCGIRPEMAIIPQMNVPTGDSAFTSDEVQPGVNWVYSWEVTENLSLAGSTQGNRVMDDNGHSYTEFAQSIASGISLTDRLSTYFEWFALFPHSANDADNTAQHFINGGFAWLLNDDVQFDIRVGNGLTANAQDLFAGSGVSIRF
jgi:hypothetical protein